MYQRDEANGFAQRDHGLTVDDADELQLLRVRGADGDNHAAAFAELREQSGRHLVSGGGDNNGVKWRYGRKTERSVAGEDADVGIAERGENLAGIVSESGVAFDGKNLCGEFGE